MGRKKRIVEDIQIVDIGHRGKAIGKRSDGQIFLVDGPVPGDVVDVLVLRKKKGLPMGVVSQFKSLSSHRTEPFCAHFSDCGGCKWQHMQYGAQLEYKAKAVCETLYRIAGVDRSLAKPIIGCASPQYFRNKLEFTFSNRRWLRAEEVASDQTFDDRNALGFHRPGQFDKIVDVQTCYLQDDLSNDIRNFVRDYAREHKLPFFDIRRQEGFLRNLTIRNTSQDQWMVLFSFFEDRVENIRELLEAVRTAFPQITSLCYVINAKKNDSIFDLPVRAYSGSAFIEEQLGDIRYRIGPKSFFQTNTLQTKTLLDCVSTFADWQGNELVYDLYTGIGSIALYVAHRCAQVVGIETIESAIEDAKKNAALNHIDNATFYCGQVEELLDEAFVERNGRPDVVIIDPPRAGMHPDVVQTLLAIGAPKLIYVSCNPATQARDLQALSAMYTCSTYQPIDMFPHTDHVENIALLMRNE